MHLTEKQFHIMTALVKGNADGSFLDLDQLVEKVPYDTTKQSIQFSIRHLAKKGLAEKHGTENRRDRRRVIVAPTAFGYEIMHLRTKI